ncbi:OmpA family protein [Pararhodobacter sp.]|uniref:OmpA family protein n=1 Tax=Pararhodobacter sp. TaxID=2127056 RepID=UPI002AFE3D69|nr:OmpA family protein [Pararhodobacter sp.]
MDGHTDNVPIPAGGAYASNWELSQARALSVVLYMIEDLGFPPERLAAAGFGEFRPVDPGNSAEARAQNRRIELKLTER